MYNNPSQKRKRGPGSKQDHSDFSFTQEEFSADVFWGESPPVDDVPDIFDGRECESRHGVLPAIDEEEWTAPVPKRSKSKPQAQLETGHNERSKKSIEALKALLSPTNNELNDSLGIDGDSFSEGFFDKSFTSCVDETEGDAGNGDSVTSLYDVDDEVESTSGSCSTIPSTAVPHVSTEDSSDQSFSEIDFDMLDKLVAASKSTQPQQQSQSYSTMADSDSQPGLTDSSILPISHDSVQSYCPAPSFHASKATATASAAAVSPRADVTSQSSSVASQSRAVPHASTVLPASLVNHPNHRSLLYPPSAEFSQATAGHSRQGVQALAPPPLHQTPVSRNGAYPTSTSAATLISSKASSDPYAVKRQQALEKRRLAKERAIAQETTRQRLQSHQQDHLQGKQEQYPLRRQPRLETGSQVPQVPQTSPPHEPAAPVVLNRHPPPAPGSQWNARVDKSDEPNSSGGDPMDDFAALEALMSKFDDNKSQSSSGVAVDLSQASSNDSVGCKGAELSEFDAIEAMMNSVESRLLSQSKSSSGDSSASYRSNNDRNGHIKNSGTLSSSVSGYVSKERPLVLASAYSSAPSSSSKENPPVNRAPSSSSAGAAATGATAAYIPSTSKTTPSQYLPIKGPQTGRSVSHPQPGSRQTNPAPPSTVTLQLEEHSGRQAAPFSAEASRNAGTTQCYRLIAVDVNIKREESTGRVYKHVRCVDYYHRSPPRPTRQNVAQQTDRSSIDNISVYLFDDWCDSEIRGGNILHLVTSLCPSDFTGTLSSLTPHSSAPTGSLLNEFRVDNTRGLIIIHPDVLVTPTKIADSFSCSRKAVLSDIIRGGSLSNQAAVLGSLKHQFIEQLIKLTLAQKEKAPQLSRSISLGRLSSNSTDAVDPYGVKLASIDQLIKTAVSDQASALYSAGVDDEEAVSSLWAVTGPTSAWAHQPCHSSDQQKSSERGIVWTGMDSWEEMIWSPALGIKGQVDLVLKAGDESLPVELKTGKWRPNGLIGHRAQAMLYVIMLTMRSKNNLDVSMNQPSTALPIQGILLYLGNEETKYETISPQWAEVRSLILSRNKLAVNLKRMGDVTGNSTGKYTSQLPPLLKNQTCKWCFSASECMVYHRAVADKSKGDSISEPNDATESTGLLEAAESSGVPSLFKYLTQDISTSQMTYFKHWDKLLDLENKAADQALHSRSIQHGVWTNSKERDRVFTVLSTDAREKKLFSENNNVSSELFNSFKYVWILGQAFVAPGAHTCFDMDLAAGDRLSLSLENNNNSRISGGDDDIEECGVGVADSWNVANVEPHVVSGVVLEIQQRSICIGLTKLPNRIRSIGKVMEKKVTQGTCCDTSPWLFRVDKEEFTMSLISVLRSNLLRLFTLPHDPQHFAASQAPNNSKAPSQPDNTTNPRMSPALVQLSSMVIDLTAPRFTTHFNHVYSSLAGLIDTDIQLFLPPLNPLQLLFIQNLKVKEKSRSEMSSGPLSTATRQFYECSPPPLHAGCHPLTLLQEYKLLNSGQKDVVKKVISSLDYTLLLGMPGSGKTSTLSFVIRTLVARGELVLITSYTNAAVDNLMKKLRESGVNPSVMGRLGHVGSFDSCMTEYAVDPGTSLTSTIQDLADRLGGYRIIGATVLTAARSGLLQRLAPFDWCVMDEAGQISQPAALGGMLLASKHLLVGDHYQLPPLVVSLQAQQEGMEVSMFKRLGEAHPNAVVSLTIQYRMNAEIMAVCNTLIYENRLQCGSQTVASARLRYRQSAQRVDQLPYAHVPWLQHCLAPENSVVFVNTDTIRDAHGAHGVTKSLYDGRERVYLEGRRRDNETRDLTSTVSHVSDGDGGLRGVSGDGNGDVKKGALNNPTEIAIITLLVNAFAQCGLEDIDSAVGIVSPYRAQVRSIQRAFLEMNTPHDENRGGGGEGCGSGGGGAETCLSREVLESLARQGVSTVDKYQGRDMDVIVLSLVRSNDRGMVGDLLRDWRRVNVALTRAKRKLLVIGSLEMLERVPVLFALKKLVVDMNWVVDIPAGALDSGLVVAGGVG